MEKKSHNSKDFQSVTPANADGVVIDRHHGYSSTTCLDLGPRRMLAESSEAQPTDTMPSGHSTPVSPTSPRRAKPAPSCRSLNSTGRSLKTASTSDSAGSSTRPYVKGGVPVRVSLLPRSDCMPCRMSGRRNYSTSDNIVRIFLSLPGCGHMIALWVDPNLPVGPKRPLKDRFSAFWGQDAEEAGPFGTRANVPNKRLPEDEIMTTAVPLNPHLKQISSERAQEESVMVDVGLSPRKAKREQYKSEAECSHFRAMVHDATGIPPEDQDLMFYTRRITDNEKTLADYGIGQGATILCIYKSAQQLKMENADPQKSFTNTKKKKKVAKKYTAIGDDLKGRVSTTFRSLGLSTQSSKSSAITKLTDGFRILPRWQSHARPRIFEAAAKEMRDSSLDNISVFDYSCLPDYGCTDQCGRIRKMYGIT